MRSVLITGGCGFIGSNLINHLLQVRSDLRVINLDKLDYCANRNNIAEEYRQDHSRYILFPGNVCDSSLVSNLLEIYQIEVVIHLAAQSHVDNSFCNSIQFTKDNILGTHNLLECVKKYGKLYKFIHMSTDEVYGDFTLKRGDRTLNPTNPYAATKASCELLVESYAKSFRLPTVIVRSNNVFGPHQHWEKLIPRFIKLLTQGKKCTIQGTGEQKRTFVFVDDVCRALELVMDEGKLYEIYEIGTEDEYSVLEIADMLIKEIIGNSSVDYLEFIVDRDFNDFRYQVNVEKLTQLGWKPERNFNDNLKRTIGWYLDFFSSEH